MKIITYSKIAGTALFLGSFALPASGQSTTSNIINQKNETIGELKVTKAPEGVLLNLKVSDLPAGTHGLHIHKVGDCGDVGEFKNSEGHVAPETGTHGLLNKEGPHAGDLPNLIIAEDGRAEVELFSKLLAYDSGESAILDEDGSALIIHAKADDHMSQPIGGAGNRIACAVISK